MHLAPEVTVGKSSPHSGTADARPGSTARHTLFGQSLQALLSGSDDPEQELKSTIIGPASQTVTNVTNPPAFASKPAEGPRADSASAQSSAAAAMKASAANTPAKNGPQSSPHIQRTHTSDQPKDHAIHRTQKKRQEARTDQAAAKLTATPTAPQADSPFDPSRALTCSPLSAPATLASSSGSHRADLQAGPSAAAAHSADGGKTSTAIADSPQGTSAELAPTMPLAIDGHAVASANAPQSDESHEGAASFSMGSERPGSNANSAAEATSKLHGAQSQSNPSADPQLPIAAAQIDRAGDRDPAEDHTSAGDRVLRASAQRTAQKHNATDAMPRNSGGQPAHATNLDGIAPSQSSTAPELRATAPQSLTPQSADGRQPAEARPANAHDALAALDGQAAPSASWIHADARHAEAGYLDPALGWVGVRAETAGAALHATIVPPTADAAQILASHLPALNAYIAEHHATATQVSMAAPEMGTSSQGSHHQMSRDGTQEHAQQTARGEAFDGNNTALRGRATSNSATIPAAWATGFRSGATISLLA